MAANRILGKFREDIKTALTGSKNKENSPTLELTADRIILGFNSRLASGQDTLAKDIGNNGPLTVVGLIVRGSRELRGAGTVVCPITIWIEKDKKADFDGLDIADLIEDAMSRLLTESNYTNSRLLPLNVSFVGREWEHSAHPGTLALFLEVESIPLV